MMKKVTFICLLVVTGIISDNVYCQKDTLDLQKHHWSHINVGFGTGLNQPGIMAEIDLTYRLSGNWCLNISNEINFYKAKNLPGDFNESNFNLIPPPDIINALSFKLLKEFTSQNKKLVYRIDCGPSWILYKETHFRFNPSYGPSETISLEDLFNDLFDFSDVDKYLKSRTFYTSVGLSSKVWIHYCLMKDIATGMALFMNINEFKSIVGLEFYIITRID